MSDDHDASQRAAPSLRCARAARIAAASAPRAPHRDLDRHPRRRRLRRRLVRARRQPAQDVRRPVHATSARTSTCRSARRSPSARTTCRRSATRSRRRSLDTVRGVEGVDVAEGEHPALRPDRRRPRRGREDPGRADARRRRGSATRPLSGLTIKEGAPPNGADQVAIDKATADREDIERRRPDQGDHRHRHVPVHGHRARRPRRHRRLRRRHARRVRTRRPPTRSSGADGTYDSIDIQVDRRRRPGDRATDRSRRSCPQGTEVVDRETSSSRRARQAVDTFISAFGTGLLCFAFITAFVSAFLINNVFQITIGQRLRELALMRAVGAHGRPGPTPHLHRGARDVGRRHGRSASSPASASAKLLISGLQLGRRRVPEHRPPCSARSRS